MLSAYLQSVFTPSLKAVAMHWDSVRGARLMPSWEDLQPKAIGHQLAIAWSLRYDRAQGAFTGRLAGERIARLVGKNFRGLPLAQAQTPASFASMYPVLTRVVQRARRLLRLRQHLPAGRAAGERRTHHSSPLRQRHPGRWRDRRHRIPECAARCRKSPSNRSPTSKPGSRSRDRAEAPRRDMTRYGAAGGP